MLGPILANHSGICFHPIRGFAINPFTTTKLFGASGGYIIGPGSGTSDSVPAWLSNGEYVLSADAVSRLGVPFLNALNRGQAPHFASGGYVGDRTGSLGTPSIVINLHNESGIQMEAEQTGGSFNGENYIIGVVLNAVATNKMGMRSLLQGGKA